MTVQTLGDQSCERRWYENDVTRPPFVVTALNSSFRRSEACPVPRYGAGNQRGRVAPTTPKHFQRPGPIFIPRCAGTSRHGRLVRKRVPDSDPGCIPAPAGYTNHVRANTGSRGSKERRSAGACPQPRPRDQPAGTGVLLGNLAILVLFIPTIESMPRTPIRGWNSEREGQTAIHIGKHPAPH